MKKTKHKYLLFGLVGLTIAGTAAVLYQKSGQRFQKNFKKALKITTLATKNTLNNFHSLTKTK